MIEVFKTNVNDLLIAEAILSKLNASLPGCRSNFDLSDCDRILRVCFKGICNYDVIMDTVAEYGFNIDVLDDKPATYVRPTVTS